LKTLNLLPHPRAVTLRAGSYELPGNGVLYLEPSLPRDTALLPVAARLQSAAETAGARLELVTGQAEHPRLAISAMRSNEAPEHPEGYTLSISKVGVRIHYL
jgi:hypothetical protein